MSYILQIENDEIEDLLTQLWELETLTDILNEIISSGPLGNSRLASKIDVIASTVEEKVKDHKLRLQTIQMEAKQIKQSKKAA